MERYRRHGSEIAYDNCRSIGVGRGEGTEERGVVGAFGREELVVTTAGEAVTAEDEEVACRMIKRSGGKALLGLGCRYVTRRAA